MDDKIYYQQDGNFTNDDWHDARRYLHEFFVKNEKTILEKAIDEYRLMFIYDNIPLLLGYVCLFFLGLIANCIQIYATILQLRRNENVVCNKIFLQLATSQTLLVIYLIPMDFLWRYSQVWEAGEKACQLMVWIRFYLIVTVAAFTVLQTFVRYRVMRASIDLKGISCSKNSDRRINQRLLANFDGVDEEAPNDFQNDMTTNVSRNIFCKSLLYKIGNYFGLNASPPPISNDRTKQSGTKRNFKENQLIILGWIIPMILCAPEAAVYKLHVLKEIPDYQQCADIFARPEDLLFPRLFPSSLQAEGRDESDYYNSAYYYDNQEWQYNNEYQISTVLNATLVTTSMNLTATTESSLIEEIQKLLEEDNSSKSSVDVYSSASSMPPSQILYYLMLQSLTFVIPAGAIFVLNGMTCHHSSRQLPTSCEMASLRNWAAQRTLCLSLSFGITYVVCWFPMTILMAERWNALFKHSLVKGLYYTTENWSFWSFLEEWAIAWGMLIGVANPLLYGFFYWLGGSNRKLGDMRHHEHLTPISGSENTTSQPNATFHTQTVEPGESIIIHTNQGRHRHSAHRLTHARRTVAHMQAHLSRPQQSISNDSSLIEPSVSFYIFSTVVE